MASPSIIASPVPSEIVLTDEEIDEYREAFSLFDKEGNGEISTNELGTVLRALGTNPSAAELKQMIVDVDSDGSGTVDFGEFLELLMMKMKESKGDQEWKEAFKIFDRNNDGFIDAKEIRRIMYNLGEKLTDEEIEEMINEADEDGDGMLTYKEFTSILKDD